MGHTRFSRLLIALLVSTVLSCSFVVPAYAKDKIDFESSGVVTFSRPNATTLQAGDSVTLEYKRINRGTMNLSPDLNERIFYNNNLKITGASSSYFTHLDKVSDNALGNPEETAFYSSELQAMKSAIYIDSPETRVNVTPGSFASFTITFAVIGPINTNDRLFYTFQWYGLCYKFSSGQWVGVPEDEYADIDGNYSEPALRTVMSFVAKGNNLDDPNRSNNMWSYNMPTVVPVPSVVSSLPVSSGKSGSSGVGDASSPQALTGSNANKSASSKDGNPSAAASGDGLPLKSDANSDSDKIKAAGSLKAKLPKRVAVSNGNGLLMSELLNRYGVMLLVGSVLLVVMVLFVLNKYHKANGLFRLYRRALRIQEHKG